MRPRRNWRRALALALVAVARRKVAGALMCEPTKKGQPGRSGRRQGRQGRVSTMQQIRALSTRQLANYTRNPVRVRRSPREVSPAVARWTRWQRGPRLNGDVVVSRHHAQLPPGGVQGWRACPHAQPGCRTREAPPAAARQLLSLTYSVISNVTNSCMVHFSTGQRAGAHGGGFAAGRRGGCGVLEAVAVDRRAGCALVHHQRAVPHSILQHRSVHLRSPLLSGA